MSFSKVVIEKMTYALPPNIVSSEELEECLSPLYDRLSLNVGRLELMTGIKERRFWDSKQKASEASAEAGIKLLREGNIDPCEVDLLIHSAVCRDRLEPATASYVHNLMGLGKDTQILDISNACLGFLNALILAGSMIEQGTIKRAIIVAGENGKPLVDETVNLLNTGEFNRKSIPQAPDFHNSLALQIQAIINSAKEINHRGVCSCKQIRKNFSTPVFQLQLMHGRNF